MVEYNLRSTPARQQRDSLSQMTPSPTRPTRRRSVTRDATSPERKPVKRGLSLSPEPRSPKSPSRSDKKKQETEARSEEAEVQVQGIATFWRLFGFMKAPLFRWFGILILTTTTPLFVFVLYQIAKNHQGDITPYVHGLPDTLLHALPKPTLEAAFGIACFVAVQWLLLVLIPGSRYEATLTPMGNTPVYKLNGVACYVLTHALYLALSQYWHLFPGGWCYDHLGEMLAILNISALLFCIFLFFKGLYWPSSSDAGSSNAGVLIDFYWGTELHPTFFGYNIKQFINCRLSMTGWSILCNSFALAAIERGKSSYNGIVVSALLQWIYLLKFFIWESGYFSSMDIQHDRFGFYICWGVLVWVPCTYTYHTFQLVENIPDISFDLAFAILLLGTVSIYINWQADDQRQRCRESKGDCLIWGERPQVIEAEYETGDGKVHRSLLLYSGWWGVSRHFHYIPELASCFFWTLPCMFSKPSPWFYPVYLFMLLMDRAYRDELRCSKKYGQSWKAYCKKVPYRVLPYIY